MTNTTDFDTIEPTNPVLTVAPSKEETEMLRLTRKVTAGIVRILHRKPLSAGMVIP